MRRLLGIGTIGILFLTSSTAFAADPPPLRGKAMLLMDARTGQVLYQQNGSERHFPASTTKLLTALVAVEHGDLDERILVSRAAIDKGPDSATCSISEGDEEPLEYLLYGLLLRSGNDCADAIAEGVSGGNPELFLDWMNETARELGATDSQFVNPHGLHSPDHYTTPKDLALIARAALSNPIIARIAATESFLWPGKEQNGIYYNLLNDFLQSYPALKAGKTGFTEQAGFTLAALAEQGDRQLIGVTMGYGDRTDEFADIRQLFEFGFEEFTEVDAVSDGSAWGEVAVVDGEAPSVPVMAGASFPVSARQGGDGAEVTVVPHLPDAVEAPVAAGQPIGHLEIREGETRLGTVPLLAQVGVAASPPAPAAAAWGVRIALSVAGIALVATGLALAVFLLRAVARALRRRRRRIRSASRAALRSPGTHGMITSYRTRFPR